MLPDFPELKNELHELLYHSAETIIRFNSVIGKLPPKIIVECENVEIKRADGSTQIMSPKRSESGANFKYKEMEILTLKEVFSRILQSCLELSNKGEKNAFETLNEEITSAGRTIDVDGKPLSPEILLKGIELIDINFDKFGNPDLPAFISGMPIEKVKKELDKLFSEEPYKKSYKELIERKKRDWRDRESNRKLVG
ncbi:MAG: hypothetical protein MJE63_26630 [Proteobacteria bacterium]|nr:hypothetical protein [Pseudomonadota bacterium]